MRLLLDTVTFIWALTSPGRISKKAIHLLQREESIREISAISLSEVAIKQAKGKIALRKEDVTAGIADLRLRVLPYTLAHAVQLFELPLHHADPFDRQIIAQAFAENIPVVTSDAAFKLYQGLKVIW